MSSSQFDVPGLRHTYQSAISRSRLARATPNDLASTVYGLSVGGPSAYFPADLLGEINDFLVYDNPQGVAGDYTTTDGQGVGASWFATLNSGTCYNNSTQVGYEGLGLLTTAASSNPVTFIHTFSQKSIANTAGTGGRWSGMKMRAYFPDPNVTAWEFLFGWGNKQASPFGTQFTDGAWIQAVTSASNAQFTGYTRHNSGTAQTTTLTNYKVASGAPQSFEIATILIGQTKAIFMMRDPSLTSPINSGGWTSFAYSTVANLPLNSVELRPHFAFSGMASTAVALNFEAPQIFLERLLNY